MLKNKEWFGAWFDSPYYHILYKHRDDKEARGFIDHLITYFHFSAQDRIMDLACGKGRHAIYLNKKGLDVVGLDLSPQNIAHASKFENERLKFYVHDMRQPWPGNKFDYVLNLFTSFGYFENKGENQQAIQAIASGMVPGGQLLIDFLNPYTVINNMVPEEVKTINGITFHIQKSVEGEFIVKDINFEHLGRAYHFQEKVKAIRRLNFMEYFKNANLELIDLFGDYKLNSYIAEKSERMIFVLRK
ncbi:MAG: class I SAM-dependent methyltransferase [Cyclobacteriaceae bacterium]|nr:class I SAM-dependent methyltransferase [Cyclobacteriaceae bacterium]